MAEFTFFDSPAGRIRIVAEDNFITRIDFSAQPVSGHQDSNHPLLRTAVAWLERYFAGEQPDPAALPVKLCGSDFQMAVWEILKTVPYGKITTYGAIAKQLSPTMSAQAVGGAVGRNPVSIVVPCHRVLGANAKLTGYTGGLDKKRYLLELENIPYIE